MSHKSNGDDKSGGSFELSRRSFLTSTMAAGLGATAITGLSGMFSANAFAQEGPISGTIRFTIWFGPGDIEVWEGVIKDFEAANPGVKVQFEPITWDEYWTKLNTQFASGTAPDVMGMGFQAPLWGPKGYFEPLTDHITAEELGSLPNSVLIPGQGMSDAGLVQYALPWRLVGGSLFGNLTAMQKAGIAYPSDNWTIDEFVAAAKALTTGEQWGTAVIGSTLSTNLATAFGARPVSVDNLTATYNSPEMLAFMQWQHDLIYKHKVAPAPQDLSKQKDPFTSGTIALLPSASWMYPTYREVKDFDWDILPNPRGTVSGNTYAGADYITLYAKSQNKAAAWAFMKYAALSKAAQQPISATGLPVLIDYLKDPRRVAAEAAKKPAHYGYFVDGVINSSEGWAFVPEFTSIRDADSDATDQIMNQASPNIQAILDTANAKMQVALDKGHA